MKHNIIKLSMLMLITINLAVPETSHAGFGWKNVPNFARPTDKQDTLYRAKRATAKVVLAAEDQINAVANNVQRMLHINSPNNFHSRLGEQQGFTKNIIHGAATFVSTVKMGASIFLNWVHDILPAYLGGNHGARARSTKFSGSAMSPSLAKHSRR